MTTSNATADDGPTALATSRIVALTLPQFDLVRHAMLDSVHEGLVRTADQVDELRQQSALDDGVLAADARGSIDHLRRELDALEALGWYDKHLDTEGPQRLDEEEEPEGSGSEPSRIGDLMAVLEDSLANVRQQGTDA